MEVFDFQNWNALFFQTSEYVGFILKLVARKEIN
jgi:hypothetical protein